MNSAIHHSDTDRTDAAGAARRARLRMLDVLLTPAAARLGGVFIATGPFVAGAAASADEAQIALTLVFDAKQMPLAEKAAVAAAAAAGLRLRLERTPGSDGVDPPADRIVFGERRSTADDRRPARPEWTRANALHRGSRSF